MQVYAVLRRLFDSSREIATSDRKLRLTIHGRRATLFAERDAVEHKSDNLQAVVDNRGLIGHRDII